MNTTTELRGTVDRITFYNSVNGFAVIELNTGKDLVTAVGTMFDIHGGEEVRLFGSFDVHATFGEQFKVASFEVCPPTSAAAMLRYLSGGGIKGIGPSLARKIIDRFGVQAMDILEKDPLRLTAIKGISKDKAYQFQASYLQQIGVRELVSYLSQFAIAPDEVLHIYRTFGSGSLERVKANPYLLCCEEAGFSFDRVDSMAADMGFGQDFGFRMYSGVEYVLRHNLNNGHTCIPREKLVSVSQALLGSDESVVQQIVEDMLSSGRLCRYAVSGRDYLFLPSYYQAESNAAKRIATLLHGKGIRLSTMDAKIHAVEKQLGIAFEERQLEAIHAVAESGMLVLTGGPGTGKTTTLNAIIRVFESAGLSVLLAAPTGRAAKRMSEVTGYEAKTIHRLLEAELDEQGRFVFSRNIHNPLSCDLLIIDEVSMVDAFLFDKLLQALPYGCRLILVGDSDQLPSVGAGNVLHDLMDSCCVPTVQLRTVFRQAMQSAIVTNAHSINNGDMPDLSRRDSDFFFLPCDDPAEVAQTVENLVTVRLPKAYGFSSCADIQVLCPSRKNETGTLAMNQRLQRLLNAPDKNKRELVFPQYILRQGDKVMQIRNNYNIEWTRDDGTTGIGVYNGDVGTLEKVDLSLGLYTVRFDDRVAVYPAEAADQLELAYAITVHKSQGSEYPCVVLPISDMPPQLRYRNLLYTAVTRARNRLIVVGSQRMLSQMIENDRRVKRYTMLCDMLKEACR